MEIKPANPVKRFRPYTATMAAYGHICGVTYEPVVSDDDCGDDDTAFRATRGDDLHCWGRNDHGQLGSGQGWATGQEPGGTDRGQRHGQQGHPDDPTTLFNQAAEHLNALDDDAARPLLERAVALRPDDARTWLDLAEIWSWAGNHLAAEADLKAAAAASADYEDPSRSSSSIERPRALWTSFRSLRRSA